MTNIVLLVRDRPRLTEQTLRTLYEETPRDQFNLVIVDDGSWPETTQIISRYSRRENCEVVTFLKPVGIVGFLRNVGVWTSERVFGRGDYLYFSDNDVAFLGDWLRIMTDRLDYGYKHGVSVLGGYQHPYHGRIGGSFATAFQEGEGIVCTDAVAGYSQLMYWDTWDRFGPFDQRAKGVCQSEDFAFCRKICTPIGGPVTARGDNMDGFVGYVTPPVIANCGITNSEGKPAIGSESFPRIPGLIYE